MLMVVLTVYYNHRSIRGYTKLISGATRPLRADAGGGAFEQTCQNCSFGVGGKSPEGIAEEVGLGDQRKTLKKATKGRKFWKRAGKSEEKKTSVPPG